MVGRLQPLGYFQQLLGFDVGVGEQVGFQVGPLVETSLADWTSVWSLLEVKDLVNSQCATLTESFSTVATFEWFLFGVDVAVVPQVILPTESFSTDVAGIRSLVCVGSFVDEKVVTFGEFPIAVFADETFLRS